MSDLCVFLGGGFKHVLFSPRKLGKIPILTHIFQMGRFNHQPVLYVSSFRKPPESQGSPGLRRGFVVNLHNAGLGVGSGRSRGVPAGE